MSVHGSPPREEEEGCEVNDGFRWLIDKVGGESLVGIALYGLNAQTKVPFLFGGKSIFRVPTVYISLAWQVERGMCRESRVATYPSVKADENHTRNPS